MRGGPRETPYTSPGDPSPIKSTLPPARRQSRPQPRQDLLTCVTRRRSWSRLLTVGRSHERVEESAAPLERRAAAAESDVRQTRGGLGLPCEDLALADSAAATRTRQLPQCSIQHGALARLQHRVARPLAVRAAPLHVPATFHKYHRPPLFSARTHSNKAAPGKSSSDQKSLSYP